MLAVLSPIPQYFDLDGSPLDNGTLRFGVEGGNPETAPITVYWDAAGTQPAAQPIGTVNGFPARTGSPALLYADSTYSLMVKNRQGILVYYSPSSAATGNDEMLQTQITTLIADLASAAVGKGSKLVRFIQRLTGAVARWVEDKLADSLNVKDFGAVPDGVWSGTVPGGTDNLAAFNAAIAAAVASGISTVDAAGVFYLSGKLSIPQGITLRGVGTAHLPIFLGGTIRGTVLLVNGANANDCVALTENTGHNGLRDISIYHTNANAIRSVVACVGNLYPRLKNVEIASLRKTTGAGLYLGASLVGSQWATLWGEFDGVVAMCANVGTGTEASIRYGLQVYGSTAVLVPNANSFKGGNLIGTWAGVYADGALPGTGALSCVFHGTKIDVNWDGTFAPVFKAAAQNVFGFSKANVYIFPTIRLNRAISFAFHGCYFEAAGNPSVYDDGANGSATLLSVVWLDDPTEVTKTGIVDCNWNAVYLYDNGSQTEATPITSGQRHTTRVPAMLSVRAVGTQAVPTAAWTKVTTMATVVAGDDSELEWDAVNNVAVIRSAGCYLVSAQVEYSAGWATATTYATCRIVGGGYTIQGNNPTQGGAAVPITAQASIPAIPLVRGDTIELQTLHNQGGNQNAGGANTYLSIVKIG